MTMNSSIAIATSTPHPSPSSLTTTHHLSSHTSTKPNTIFSSKPKSKPSSHNLSLLQQFSHNPKLLQQIHTYILKTHATYPRSQLSILNTCLLNGYLRCGCIDHARRMFVTMPDKDVVAFTSMMKGFAEAGLNEEAIGVFRVMVESEDLMINEYAYSCASRVCAETKCLFLGRQIHASVAKSMMGTDVFVGTGLVDFYVKCGEIEDARKAFMGISEPNVISFNALLSGDLGNREGIQLFFWMRLMGVAPDCVTFASVLRRCKDKISVCSIKQLHGLIVKMIKPELDVFVSCALFEAYIDSGCFGEAQKVFDSMKKKDDAAYNLGIQGCFRNGHEVEAMNFFIEALKMRQTVREVTSTAILVKGGSEQGKQLHALVIKTGCREISIASSLIRMYCEHKHFDEAIRLFEEIPFPDIVLWTDLISNFSKCGESERALNLYVNMITDRVSEPPNNFTFSTILKSCANLAAAIVGKQIHGQIIKSNLSIIKSDPFVISALLYMYSKCGYIKEAKRLFIDMPERDLASWNAIITSLAQHGFAQEAIKTFQDLLNQKDLKPNNITYLGVLTACCHGGLVELGYQYFKSIREPTIEHYACLINLLARRGRLKEAMYLAQKMPFEANEIIWTSILAASSLYGNVELGEHSAKKLQELNPKDPGTYIVLSNIYAAAGKWEDMKRTRKLMKSQIDSKHSGVSWLRVNGETHGFDVAGIRSSN